MTSSPFSSTVSLRSEGDLLALIPQTFGFHPEDSLVLVSVGRDRRPFQARIDLPDEPDELPEIVAPLVHAAVRNDGRHALIVVYSDDDCLAEEAAGLLGDALESAGLEVLVTIRADGSRWYPLGLEHLDIRSFEGTPYDVASHELTSRGVLEGRVTYRSREELVDSLAPVDVETVDEVLDACDRLDPLPTRDTRALRAEGGWLLAQVRAYRERRAVPGPLTVARVLRAVGDTDVRDLAWSEIGPVDAEQHAGFWREVVRRSPEPLVAPAAGLLAFAAWLSGDGALAWCAVDRSLSADPDHTLARLVAQALENAMSPRSWEPVDPASLRLYAG